MLSAIRFRASDAPSFFNCCVFCNNLKTVEYQYNFTFKYGIFLILHDRYDISYTVSAALKFAGATLCSYKIFLCFLFECSFVYFSNMHAHSTGLSVRWKNLPYYVRSIIRKFAIKNTAIHARAHEYVRHSVFQAPKNIF